MRGYLFDEACSPTHEPKSEPDHVVADRLAVCARKQPFRLITPAVKVFLRPGECPGGEEDDAFPIALADNFGLAGQDVERRSPNRRASEMRVPVPSSTSTSARKVSHLMAILPRSE